MSAPSSTKSLEVLKLLAETSDLSQRDIALRSGASLGMVNLVLRRLVRTGYIKIVNMDRRKVRYILTAKGLVRFLGHSFGAPSARSAPPSRGSAHAGAGGGCGASAAGSAAAP